jgi:prevent-host-death family protein
MPDIGVRELKIHASDILRQVREEKVRFVVTHRGRPVALLMPLEAAEPASPVPVQETATPAWERLTQLGEEIGREWRSPLTSTELLSDMRR